MRDCEGRYCWREAGFVDVSGFGYVFGFVAEALESGVSRVER